MGCGRILRSAIVRSWCKLPASSRSIPCRKSASQRHPGARLRLRPAAPTRRNGIARVNVAGANRPHAARRHKGDHRSARSKASTAYSAAPAASSGSSAAAHGDQRKPAPRRIDRRAQRPAAPQPVRSQSSKAPGRRTIVALLEIAAEAGRAPAPFPPTARGRAAIAHRGIEPARDEIAQRRHLAEQPPRSEAAWTSKAPYALRGRRDCVRWARLILETADSSPLAESREQRLRAGVLAPRLVHQPEQRPGAAAPRSCRRLGHPGEERHRRLRHIALRRPDHRPVAGCRGIEPVSGAAGRRVPPQSTPPPNDWASTLTTSPPISRSRSCLALKNSSGLDGSSAMATLRVASPAPDRPGAVEQRHHPLLQEALDHSAHAEHALHVDERRIGLGSAEKGYFSLVASWQAGSTDWV